MTLWIPMGLVEIVRFDESLKMGLLVGFGGRGYFDSDFTDDLDPFGRFNQFGPFYGFNALGGLWDAFGPLFSSF